MNENLDKYFNDMFKDVNKDIKLDKEQIEAIINDDNYTLVIAGAGTGKTTTMVGKVKYLVEQKKVDPSKILVISYTKKAVEELQNLIVDTFNINAKVTTFHSLAYSYIRKIFQNKTCEVIDKERKEKIFFDFINIQYKNKKMDDIITLFNKETVDDKEFFYSNYFRENYKKYSDYETFFDAYKNNKMEEAKKIGLEKVITDWIDKKYKQEHIITIKRELVKSVGEAVIANFLYKHGIEYQYEKVYSELMDERKPYKPDFTLDLANLPVYIEYFGLKDEKYKKNIQKKMEFHRVNNNKLIALYPNSIEEIEKELDKKLKELGFIYRDRSQEEIYNQILDNNKLAPIFKLENLFNESVNSIKESLDRPNYIDVILKYINTLSYEERMLSLKQFNYINEFYIFYSKQIITPEVYGFDYADLIYYSNKYIKDKRYLQDVNYEYIIIDEYQDISDGEYLLTKETSDIFNSKVFAVGDDWQSIYSFRGSNINYITKFNKYFETPTILTITNTYRNSQNLIDTAGNFIRENTFQIDKQLISSKKNKDPVRFVTYDDRISEGDYDTTKEYELLKKLILKIHNENKDHSILILSRRRKSISELFANKSLGFIDEIGTKISIENIEDLELDGMTIHKSKGLTYDEVIIIGMNKEFPIDSYKRFWIKDLFSYKPQLENIPYAEERRVFYVALTRTRNNVYILTNTNANHRSEFIDELQEKYKKVINNV